MIGAPNGWDGTYALPIDATWGQITNYRNVETMNMQKSKAFRIALN